MLSSQNSNILASAAGVSSSIAVDQASWLSPEVGRQSDKADVPIKPVLWRGILLVEPDMTVLEVEARLLTQSDYHVTPAFSNNELFILRDTKAVALAILTDRLGRDHLGAVAATVRRQWPNARILILGQAATLLEDHLYDEQVDHSDDLPQLLLELERLYKGLWNQRSNTLDWDGYRPALGLAHTPPLESDPTKTAPVPSPDTTILRGTPSDVHMPRTKHNCRMTAVAR